MDSEKLPKYYEHIIGMKKRSDRRDKEPQKEERGDRVDFCNRKNPSLSKTCRGGEIADAPSAVTVGTKGSKHFSF